MPPSPGPGVILISPYPPCRTGPAEYAAVFSRELARRGYPVTVLTEEAAGPTPAPPAGVSVKRGWSKGLLLPWRMYRSASQSRGDVIHVNYSFTMYGNSLTSSLTLLTFFALRRRSPLIVTLFDVFPRRELTRETLSLYSVGFPPVLAGLAVKMVLRFLSHAAEVIVVQSPTMRDVLVEDYGLPLEKVVVTELPGYPPRESPRDRVSSIVRAGRKTVLFYGFLAPYKGVEPLLEAFAEARKLGEAPSLRVVVAGTNHPRLSYDYRAELEAHARTLGLTEEEVCFPGYVDAAESERLFAASELVVLPYLQTTGSSGTLASAIGHDRPVLLTSLPPLLSQLNGYQLGRVVPPGDVDALRETLVQVENGRFVPTPNPAHARRRKATWTDLVRDTVAVYAAALYRRRPRRILAAPKLYATGPPRVD
ncbi:MAG: glycosyltransferase [Thermoplasmata archaeon]|nr:glycosyltransferase [Thermoplasmata archaeon]